MTYKIRFLILAVAFGIQAALNLYLVFITGNQSREITRLKSRLRRMCEIRRNT